jgi:hypothetical protein
LATYRCPFCGHNFDPINLQQPAGVGGGSFCPKCQQRVRVFFPLSGIVVVVSVLLAGRSYVGNESYVGPLVGGRNCRVVDTHFALSTRVFCALQASHAQEMETSNAQNFF